MAFQLKSDLPSTLADEAKKFRELSETSNRTSTGNISWTSLSSSTTYSTSTSSDPNILNKGQNGLLYWLGQSVLKPYLIDNDWMVAALQAIVKGEQYYGTDSGSTDSYAISLPTAPSAYTLGMVINFRANTANTGACSLNVNGLGAKAIKDILGADTVTGAILVGQPVSVIYDGTNFRMISQSGVLSGSVISNAGAVLTLPSSSTNIVGDNTVNVFTNKTYDTPIFRNWDGWVSANETWVQYTETKVDADINITTDAVVTTVDVLTGTPVAFTTSAPTGLTIGTIYYAIRVDSTHIKFATTIANAMLGTAINITAVGSGTRVLNILNRVVITGANVTAKYQKGDRVKLTNSTIKYFYIVSVDYISTNTILTLIGGSDYELTSIDTPISSNYYSKIENAQGFPNELNLTAPTWTTTGTAFTNQPSHLSATVILRSNVCKITGAATTNATSGGTGIFIATFVPAQLPQAYVTTTAGSAINASDDIGGYIRPFQSNILRIAKYDGTQLATNSKTMRYNVEFTY